LLTNEPYCKVLPKFVNMDKIQLAYVVQCKRWKTFLVS